MNKDDPSNGNEKKRGLDESSSSLPVVAMANPNPNPVGGSTVVLDVDTDDDNGDEDFIEICPPPPSKRANIHNDDEQQSSATKLNDQEDTPMVLWSTLINPNVDYPHRRQYCGKFPFSVRGNARQYCANCYCALCDIPASQCPSWEKHCTVIPTTPKDTSISTDEVTVVTNAGGGAAATTTTTTSGSETQESQRTSTWNRFREAFQEWRKQQQEQQAPKERRRRNYGFEYAMDDDSNDILELWDDVSNSSTRRKRQRNQISGNRSGSGSGPGGDGARRIIDILTEKLSIMAKISDSQDPQKAEETLDQFLNPTKTTQGQQQFSKNDLYPPSRSSLRFIPGPPMASTLPMQGDVAALSWHDSFFVEGVRIGWPFSTILKPQRLMAVHIIKALKRKYHVVLESPTGTGKSAAILCSVLAWQRYHAKCQQAKITVQEQHDQQQDNDNSNNDKGGQTGKATNNDKSESVGDSASISNTTQQNDRDEENLEDDRDVGVIAEPDVPTIVYCSRTHSQVAQMVASLRKTPYRPRMTVLGSRDRLCIHPELKSKGGTVLNQQCRDRKQETDRKRKEEYKRNNYDDDNPTNFDSYSIEEDVEDEMDEDEEGNNNNNNNDGGTRNDNSHQMTTRRTSRRKTKPTCSHYQQLSTFRAARAVKDRYFQTREQMTKTCCGSHNGGVGGGEQTSLGVLDIEDLVEFGKNPYRQSGIALYRRTDDNDQTIGIQVGLRHNGSGCEVTRLVPNSIAAQDGRIQIGDYILAINGVSTKNASVKYVQERLDNTITTTPTKNPLIFTVQRQDAPVEESNDQNDSGEEDVAYSDHALCPYYLSRALMPTANLIFAPYNYVLDPSIRRTLNLDLKGSVVVLDEAHNIEDTLCESGSGNYGEVDLSNLIAFLTPYSNRKEAFDTDETTVVEIVNNGGQMPMPKVAHELLLFLEKIVMYMRNERRKFESGPRFQKLKLDHARFRLSDDHSEEVSYSGPTGFGLRGEAVGCRPQLEGLGLDSNVCTKMSNFATSLQNHLSGGKTNANFRPSDDHSEEVSYSGPTGSGLRGEAVGCRSQVEETSNFATPLENHLSGGKTNADYADVDHSKESLLDNLIDLIGRVELAAKHAEHFYLAFNMKPNGNIDYATKMDDDEYAEMISNQRWRKHPKALPLVSPRTERHPNVPLEACKHDGCTNKHAQACHSSEQAVRHGEICNGDRPLWECHMTLRLLSPGLLMNELSSRCRSVILASGSLAPLPSLCAELNLYGPKVETATNQPLSLGSPAGSKSNVVDLLTAPSQATPIKTAAGSQSSPTKPKYLVGRLQVKPSPLEADHVVDLQKQLFACSIGHFPDGSPLTVSYSNYKEESFFPRLGNALATVIESIPSGGILVFVPSYSFLNKCIKCWNPTAQQMNASSSPQIWTRFLASKTKVIVEPNGSQDKFEAAREEYRDQICQEKRCILLAVFRGKMSEGISFNDDNARAVICVGVPYPNNFDRNVKAKKAYNDEQRKIRKNTNLLPGSEWYSQQAYRAIAQALGRCIRHGADYGTVILMDSRHCDDGSPNDGIPSRHKNLPKWMRHSMRTLSTRPNSGVGTNPIIGGYTGLARELRLFFQEAPIQAQRVLDKWELDLEMAQKRSREKVGEERTFDGTTGQWHVVDHNSKNRNAPDKGNQNIKVGKKA